MRQQKRRPAIPQCPDPLSDFLESRLGVNRAQFHMGISLNANEAEHLDQGSYDERTW